MHAPLTLLRVHGSLMHSYKGLSPAAAVVMTAVQKLKARLRRWMASKCPRKEVWSASQIARLAASDGAAGGSGSFSSEPGSLGIAALKPPLRHLLLNPFAVPGLLMSAILTCSYASQTSACSSCSPAAVSAAFDLFTAAYVDPALVRWKEHGVGWPVGGPSGI